MYEDFAQLHLRYARRAQAVTGLPLRTALAEWTPAARMAGDWWPTSAVSQDALSPDALAGAYTRRAGLFPTGPGVSCFRVAAEPGDTVLRLHFANAEGRGVLSAARLPQRRAELAEVLAAAIRRYPKARTVRGGSWLYHLPAYRSLFPASLLTTAAAADPAEELRYMALWGQFVRGDTELYRPRVVRFEAAITAARDRQALLAAFPLAKLDWQGPAAELLAFLRESA
jgi:hypothetical protein